MHRLRQSGKYAAVVGTGDVSVVAKAARKQGVALSGPNRNQFDGLVLFNVLDRCDAPLTLLRHLKRCTLQQYIYIQTIHTQIRAWFAVGGIFD